ncbi:class I SAM-dependent methyltransferase [Bacteroidota bacterium]
MEHSLEFIKTCPACGSEKQTENITCVDHTYSKDDFKVTECGDCGLLFTNPRPTENAIGEYYHNPNYVSHTDTSEGLLFKIYNIVKTFSLRLKRKQIERLTRKRTILDYGAGTGDFSVALTRNGWNVSAYEPEPTAAAKIKEKSNNIKLVNSLEEISANSIAVVSLWHVLEHVHRLQETLIQFSRIIENNGHLVIAVPNHRSYDSQFYSQNWAAYDLPRHLYHFSPKTIIPLLEKHGFKLQSIKPMWFDSFYVSLLSEQIKSNQEYSNSLIGWIRASAIGCLSNFYALTDTKKCSSVIYICKKAV